MRSKAVKHPHWLRTSAKALAVVAVVGLVGLSLGCETTAVRAFRGARHYAAGNDALANKDGARAIEELEQAAVLVPHASEIQNHLGLAYWSEGEFKAARNSFERALELNCENQAAALNLEELRTSNRSTLAPRNTGAAQSGQFEGVGGNVDGG